MTIHNIPPKTGALAESTIADNAHNGVPKSTLKFESPTGAGATKFPITITSMDRTTAKNMQADTVSGKKTLKSYLGQILGIVLGTVRAIGCLVWSPITFLKYVYYSVRYLDNNQDALTADAKKALKVAATSFIWSPLAAFRKTYAYLESWGNNASMCAETTHFMAKDKAIVKKAVTEIKRAKFWEARENQRSNASERRSRQSNAETVKAIGECCGCIAACLGALAR